MSAWTSPGSTMDGQAPDRPGHTPEQSRTIERGRPPKRWSLAGWITRWFTIIVVLLALVISAVGAIAVTASTERELSALANEELEELDAFFSTSAGRVEDFENIARVLDQKHPENRLAWRVVDVESGDVWGEFGHLQQLARVEDLPMPARDLLAFDRTLRWKTTELTDGREVGVLLDATSQLILLRRFRYVSLFIVIATALLSSVAGWILGRRVSGLLKKVADETRIVRSPADVPALDVAEPPDEIREVSAAMNEMLGNIRTEMKNAQLITSGMAHELRSPIQNLLSETEVALLSQRSTTAYRDVLESNLEELRDLARAVDNLVTLCADSEARHGRASEHFDLDREVALRLEREQQRAQRRGVAVSLHASGPLSYHGDREAILLVIGNLVTNAIQWSAEGGRVEVRMTDLGDRIELTVDDAGPGIPRDRRATVFEPFATGPPAPGGRVGYGLGLALSRRAVEAHGGTLELSTSSLGGARFRAVLPTTHAEKS